MAASEAIYCGSADWMPRNLFERCEVLFPVNDVQLRTRLKDEILAAYLADTAKTRVLEPDGDYRHGQRMARLRFPRRTSSCSWPRDA